MGAQKSLLVHVPRCLLAFPATVRDGLAPGVSEPWFVFEAFIAVSVACVSEREITEKFAV